MGAESCRCCLGVGAFSLGDRVSSFCSRTFRDGDDDDNDNGVFLAGDCDCDCDRV